VTGALDGLQHTVPAAVAHRARHGVRRGAEPAEDGRRVQVGGEQELAHLLLDVAAQPGHRGELGPVSLLVQAHPPAEVVRVDPEFALDHHDVRRDQGQPAGRRDAVGRAGVRRQEKLVLAEDPAGQIGEDQPGLDAGDPGSHRRDDRSARGVAPLPQVLSQWVEHDPEAVHVGPDPARPVHDGDPAAAVLAGSGHAGDRPDRLGHLVSEGTEFRDHRPRLTQADLGSWPCPPDPSRDGHVPIDHLPAAHPSTVRARGARGSPVARGSLTGTAVHRLRQPHPARAEAIRSSPSAAFPRPAAGTWSVMNAKASSRPLAS
jgi:hypothetical protein